LVHPCGSLTKLVEAAVASPEAGGASTSQGHPYAVFQRALKRRNVLSALAAAKDLPQLSLADALELTVLVARKDPRRHARVASRWLLRYVEEDPHATIEEAALAAASLVGLTNRLGRGGVPSGRSSLKLIATDRPRVTIQAASSSL
jgi:hypothetical protein